MCSNQRLGKALISQLIDSEMSCVPFRPFLQNAFFTTDNKLLVVADFNGVGIYDWAADCEVRRLKYPGTVRQVIPHPDGRHLVTVNGNGTVYILRLPDLLNR